MTAITQKIKCIFRAADTFPKKALCATTGVFLLGGVACTPIYLFRRLSNNQRRMIFERPVEMSLSVIKCPDSVETRSVLTKTTLSVVSVFGFSLSLIWLRQAVRDYFLKVSTTQECCQIVRTSFIHGAKIPILTGITLMYLGFTYLSIDQLLDHWKQSRSKSTSSN